LAPYCILTNGCLMMTAYTQLAPRLTINGYAYLSLFPYNSSRHGDRSLSFLSVAIQKASPNPLPYLQNTPRQFLCSHDGSTWYWNDSPTTHVRDRITIQIYCGSGACGRKPLICKENLDLLKHNIKPHDDYKHRSFNIFVYSAGYRRVIKIQYYIFNHLF
jgi:hypothetical protein